MSDDTILSWTRDHRFILLRRNSSKSGSDLATVSIAGDQPEGAVMQSPLGS